MDIKNGHEIVNGTECISCISCDVSNCFYNDQAKHCTADRIVVGPHNAANLDETACDTFMAK